MPARGPAVLLAALVLGGLVFQGVPAWRHRALSRPPGVLAAQEPLQKPTVARPYRQGRYTIEPLQDFEVRARILSVETYRFDPVADLAPMDLALGWGRMSDSAVLASIDISQGQRFYHWRTDAPPIPLQEIVEHSANMHIIPASSAVARRLQGLRPGQVVNLRGWLVEVRGDDGGVWRSSLIRQDQGAGACEIVVVQDLSTG